MSYKWTEENILKLRDLHAQGLSFAQIAGVLHISREAVGGMCYRLRLTPLSIQMAARPHVKRQPYKPPSYDELIRAMK